MFFLWRLKKEPVHVYIQLQFWSQFFFSSVFTVNLLYQATIVQLNPLQLILVGTVLEATVLLCELPTGIIADRISRKVSIILGYVLIGVGFLLQGMVPLFWAVLASQLIWGLGYTCISGATQAWLADEAGNEKASAAFVKGARMEHAAQFMAIPFSVCVGYFSLTVPIIIGGLGMMGIACILFYAMKENNFQKNTGVDYSITAYLKKTFFHISDFCRRSMVMRLLLGITVCFGFFSEAFDRLWVTHLLANDVLRHLSESYSVYFFGGIQFVVALLSFLALRKIEGVFLFQRMKTVYRLLLLCSLMLVAGAFGFAWSRSMLALLFFYGIVHIMRNVMMPIENIWLNSLIPETTHRAAFFSMKGQVDAMGQIIGGPFIGALAVRSTLSLAYTASALILIPACFMYHKAMTISRS
ncbi:MFS transporter [Bacillus testis]|uniref:MFS transporter n=1 Tax=Bacillus testis TaxID=1622072 RepID=UPI00067E9CBD|nr:MFS transporter [Bacillus testis]